MILAGTLAQMHVTAIYARCYGTNPVVVLAALVTFQREHDGNNAAGGNNEQHSVTNAHRAPGTLKNFRC